MIENRFANVATHRLPLARRAQREGFDVRIASLTAGDSGAVEREGFVTDSLEHRASSIRLLREMRLPLKVRKAVKTYNPDVCHLITIRSVLLGLAGLALLRRRPAVICSVTGLGYIFTAQGFAARIAQSLVGNAIGLLQKRVGATFIFQNSDDRDLFAARRWVPHSQSVLIRGSGVDTKEFLPSPLPQPAVVLFCGRYLAHKGIFEFVEATRLLRNQGVGARFALSGAIDPDNPASASASTVEQWVASGIIEDWGYSANMPALLSKASIVVLPSYREGLPKVVLEASSCGRPVVTTNAPGCREAVLDGQTGLIVPVNDSAALAAAIRRLVDSPQESEAMGLAGRVDVMQRFSAEAVATAIIDVYKSASAAQTQGRTRISNGVSRDQNAGMGVK